MARRLGRTSTANPVRTSGLVVALGLGVAVATGHGVAWADTGTGDSSGGSPKHSESATTKGASAGSDNTPDSATASGATSSDSAAATQGSKHNPSDTGGSHKKTRVAPISTHTPMASKVSPTKAEVEQPTGTGAAAVATPAHTAAPTTTASAAQVTTKAALRTAAPTIAPVSAIATILALPARIVDGLLGLVGVTTASGTTPTPISPAPVIQLIWAAFRRFESIAGLDSVPPNQPAQNSETYTGSLTTPTPTVAELLDAATAEYVLGGQPGGLTPFTVNGIPVRYSDVLTGTSAQVWVTPQNQIIVAYQGTTGGTNLLFHPLIAVTQILADTQAVLTHTTPAVFPDALSFAQQVQSEAAAQGYTSDNIFLTGHSLGGWEAEYVAQNTGLGGIGFESPGLNTSVPGNGANSLFVNTATYGDLAAYFASDMSGLQPIESTYVPGGGINPHYGSIVMLGDPSSEYPLTNAAALWPTGVVGDLIFAVTAFGQFLEYHLPGVQAYSLDVNPEPDLLPGTGTYTGPVYTGFGGLTIPEFLAAASADGILVQP